MKIGIYGGTFAPPHLGHMEAARTALEQMNLDRLIIIPDCEPPHKDLAEEAATPQQRLEMAALMADGLGPRAEVSDLEIRREGKSYTADTVEALHETFPEDELWLLMGTDMFLTVQNWYQPERIFQYAGVAAFSRSEEDTQALCQNKDCKFAIWKNNKWWAAKKKQPTKAVVSALLNDGRVRVTGLYSEKTGKTYDATVVLEDDGQYANFKLEFDQRKGGSR